MLLGFGFLSSSFLFLVSPSLVEIPCSDLLTLSSWAAHSICQNIGSEGLSLACSFLISKPFMQPPVHPPTRPSLYRSHAKRRTFPLWQPRNACASLYYDAAPRQAAFRYESGQSRRLSPALHRRSSL